MYGLLMMKLYLDEMLRGEKNNDARLYPTEKRGTIALVDSRTYKAYGLAELTDVREISYEEFVKWHQTGPFANTPIAPYSEGKTCYSYELRNIRRITLPVQLQKREGSHMWVSIPDEKVRSFTSQRTLF